jgi:hypothetical protein
MASKRPLEEEEASSEESEEEVLGEGVTAASSASRGYTRSGRTFREENRPYFESLAELRRVHRRVFMEDAALALLGENLKL